MSSSSPSTRSATPFPRSTSSRRPRRSRSRSSRTASRRRCRSSPQVTGYPAAGFEISSVDRRATGRHRRGRHRRPAGAHRHRYGADRRSAASRRRRSSRWPSPCRPASVALDVQKVRVTIRIRAVTATRTYEVGVSLIGARSGFDVRRRGRPGAPHGGRESGRPGPDRRHRPSPPTSTSRPRGRDERRRSRPTCRRASRSWRRARHRSRSPSRRAERLAVGLRRWDDCSARMGSVASPMSTCGRRWRSPSAARPRDGWPSRVRPSSSARTPVDRVTCSSRPSSPARPASASTSTSVGVVPTPALAFLARTGPYEAGIMVSASHNPAEDNGLKVLDADGLKLDDDIEDELEELIWREAELGGVGNAELGRSDRCGRRVRAVPRPSARARRLDRCQRAAHRARRGERIGRRGLAAGSSRRPGAVWTRSTSNRTGSTSTSAAARPRRRRSAREVVARGADVGFALDGDADRLIAVDGDGEIVDGDQVLGILALEQARSGCAARWLGRFRALERRPAACRRAGGR